MANKSEPTVVEDFLDEDTEIPGQRYVLLSFISPEKVLDKKDQFFFKKFLESYEVDWKIKNLEKYMQQLNLTHPDFQNACNYLFLLSSASVLESNSNQILIEQLLG